MELKYNGNKYYCVLFISALLLMQIHGEIHLYSAVTVKYPRIYSQIRNQEKAITSFPHLLIYKMSGYWRKSKLKKKLMRSWSKHLTNRIY